MTEHHVTHVYWTKDARNTWYAYAKCVCSWQGHWFLTERDAQDQALLHLQGAS